MAEQRCYCSGMITAWWVSLDAPRLADPQGLRALSADEVERAARFVFAADAVRWRASRLALRELLGARLRVDPGALEFRASQEGRPALRSHPSVAFSLSHCEDRALIAVGGPAAIGVDVERRRPVPERASVIAAAFTPEEQHALAALPDAQQEDAFLRGWTRKEALAKALGVGVPALARLAVSLGPADARVLAVDGSAAEAREWSVVDLELEAPFVGALAAHAPTPGVRLSPWPAP
jgi:4'-phosphopantetheinyl transferase